MLWSELLVIVFASLFVAGSYVLCNRRNRPKVMIWDNRYTVSVDSYTIADNMEPLTLQQTKDIMDKFKKKEEESYRRLFSFFKVDCRSTFKQLPRYPFWID